jgi:hypothetical protein
MPNLSAGGDDLRIGAHFNCWAIPKLLDAKMKEKAWGTYSIEENHALRV